MQIKTQLNRPNFSKFAVALFLIYTMIGGYGFACKDSTGNPNLDSKVRQLVRAEDDFAQGLKSGSKVISDAKATGVLSQEDIDFLKPILKTVAESHLQVIKLTKESITKFGENFPLETQQQILSMISFVSDQLTELNNSGVLRIKNKEKQLLFSAIVLTMQTSATTVVAILNIKGVK